MDGWIIWTKKWWPALLMLALSLLSYLDRQSFAVLSPTILSSAHLSAQGYSEIVSGFSIAYMIGNPLWGSVIDRLGVRLGLTIAVLLWTLASVSHIFAAGFAGFMMARILLGAGEAATFPGVLRTVSDTLPERDRGKGIALGYAGISAASVIAPILFIPLAGRFGWRACFMATGVFGAAWVLLWRWTVPAINVSSGRGSAGFNLPNIRERRFWLVFASYAMGALPLGPVLYLAPLYLRSIGYNQGQLAGVLWIPPLGWEAGSFFWAWVMDRYSSNPARPTRILSVLGLLSLPLAGIALCRSGAAVVALFFLAMFVAGGFLVVALRSSILWYPPENASMVAGIGAGSWSFLVAVLLPFFGRLFDSHQHGLAFVIVALIPVSGVLLWLKIASGVRGIDKPSHGLPVHS